VYQVYKVTFIDNSEWKLPFNFALGLHLALLLSVIYLPKILDDTPLYPEIYTVDLINIEAPAPQPAQPAPAPPKPVEKPEPVEEKVAIEEKSAVAVEKPAEPEAAPAQPVSIQPLKRKKIVKRTDTVSAEQKKELERINRQRLAQARRAEQLAQEAARQAASEAVTQLKEMIRQTSPADNRLDDIPPPRSQSRQASSGSSRNVIENQYFASVFSKVQPHWKLPEHKMQEKDLAATIVIRVAQNGTITDQFFENKSGDRLFDQFVLKALQDASPLPPIPPVLQEDGTMEIGLHFKPGSIQ